jgi:hypothetical protein
MKWVTSRPKFVGVPLYRSEHAYRNASKQKELMGGTENVDSLHMSQDGSPMAECVKTEI